MSRMRLARKIAIAALFLTASAGMTTAGEVTTYDLTLHGKAFSPTEISVKAGEGFRIKLMNHNLAPAELESHELGFEKVVSGHAHIIVYVRPQKPGTYKFYDDFHPNEIIGHLIVQ